MGKQQQLVAAEPAAERAMPEWQVSIQMQDLDG
jgi:hypothetical protein